jgi:prolyl-tRNA synthetase
VREFTMKDAYSFHTSQECLELYYQDVHAAYERIFRRAGLKNCVSIQSDTGMMGGKMSHEFMAVAECGEDTIYMSPDGRYKANKEIATSLLPYVKEAPLPLEKVHTPGQKTIEEVAGFLGIQPSQTAKAVFFADAEGALILAVIRGDLEVNETKLRNHLKTKELKYANDGQIQAAGGVAGYASPLGLAAAKVRVIVDRSVAESSNLVTGANEPDYHHRNFNCGRDLPGAEVLDIATVRPGDPCPVTGQPLVMCRGIEVGNIFQLGTRYTEKMNCTYLDQNGKAQPMVMGCYGIGVGRTMAAVIEQSHDQYGPVWPMSIAPYQVHLVSLNPNQPGVKDYAEALYQELRAAGLEVLYDDRGEKAGFAFADADLIGVPLRLIVSAKTLALNQVEFKTRDGNRKNELLDRATVVGQMKELVAAALT